MHTSKYKIPTPDPPQKATNEDDFSTQNAIRRTKPTRINRGRIYRLRTPQQVGRRVRELESYMGLGGCGGG